MLWLARGVYFAAISACLLVGGVAGAFVFVQLGPADLAWWSCGVVPGAFAVAALVACFTPHDAPASTPRWVGVLCGAALGGALIGLPCYPTSFALLSPALVLYAWALRWAALTTSRSRLAQLEDPPPLTRMTPTAVGGGLVASWALLAMLPSAEGPAPTAPLAASVAPIISRPPVELDRNRVRRREGILEAQGRRVEVKLSLMRPRVQIEARKQTLWVEPCLSVTRGSTDGFLTVGPLNGYSLALSGLARADFVEGWARGYLRADYLQSRLGRGLLPRLLNSGPPPRALSGTVVVVADLEAGWVAVEGLTRVQQPLSVERLEGCRIELRAPGAPSLRLGLGGGAQWELDEGARPDPEVVIFDRDSARLIRVASRGRVASAQGERLEWLVLTGPRDAFLLLAPDWQGTASLAPVPAGPEGFLANSLLAWRGPDYLGVVFDPGSSRFGAVPLASTLPPGVYRTRLAITPLNPGEGPRAAARSLARQLGW
ncbi:MAG: hypothetical protein R3F62_05875 [Planctomycetota bacterium]